MSDILIRGMEMPRDCPMCILAHFNKLDEFTGCDAAPGKRYVPHSDEQFWNSAKRPDWCPLVPLPAGHGRLIDADALQAKFEVMENALEEHGRPYSFAFKDGGEMCAEWWTVQDALSREPTIVPAEGGTDNG